MSVCVSVSCHSWFVDKGWSACCCLCVCVCDRAAAVVIYSALGAKNFYFIVNRWCADARKVRVASVERARTHRLATDEDDGQIVREVTASSDDKEITSPLARYSLTFITGCDAAARRRGCEAALRRGVSQRMAPPAVIVLAPARRPT